MKYADDVSLVLEPGYTFTRELDYQAADGSPINITGWTATFVVNVGGTSVTGTATIPLGTDGKILVGLTATQTATFHQSWGVWRVQLTTGTGAKPPFVHGLLDVHRGR